MFKKVDANHARVVAALRQCGCSVQSTAAIGKGFPDLVVCNQRGRLFLMEVKDGKKSPSARRLTPDEKEFHQNWKGIIHVVNSPEEAVMVINKL